MYRLYLSPNNPLKTLFLCESGCRRYKVTTHRTCFIQNTSTTQIHRHGQDLGQIHLVAFIKWKKYSRSVIRSTMFEPGYDTRLDLAQFMPKVKDSPIKQRFFTGPNGQEYVWKDTSEGLILSNYETKKEIARFTRETYTPKLVHSDRRWFLLIQDEELHADFIITTFVIMAKRRRQPRATTTEEVSHDEDVEPMEGGCGEC